MPFSLSVTSILDEFPCLPGEMQRNLWQKASDSESGAAKQDEPLSHTRNDRARYPELDNSYAIGPKMDSAYRPSNAAVTILFVAWFLAIDKSGHDRRACPNELRIRSERGVSLKRKKAM